MPIEQKESYKRIETSVNTQSAVSKTVKSMVIVLDREGDIYEKFATIPNEKTDLLIRARANRRFADGMKLFDCLSNQVPQSSYQIILPANKKRKPRTAEIEVI